MSRRLIVVLAIALLAVLPARAQETTPTTVQRLSTAELARQDPATVADVARLIPAA